MPAKAAVRRAVAPVEDDVEDDVEVELSLDGSELGDASDDDAMGGGGMGGAFSKAFDKIMGKRLREEDEGGEGGPILAKSKKVQKDLEEAKAEKEARAESRKAKMELKARGHVIPTKPGLNTEHDAHEKALLRVATKGVVRLFNAVSKTQKTLSTRDSGSQKMSKSAFLAELKGDAGAAAAKGGADRRPIGGEQAADAGAGAGWDVLQGDALLAPGATKMKDWDRESDGGSGSDAGLGSDDDGPGDLTDSDDDEGEDELEEEGEEEDLLASSEGEEDEDLW